MDPARDSYSAFQAEDPSGRTLPDVLKSRGIRRLYVGGLATDYCVRATALDARRSGFGVILLADAVRGVDVQAGDSERAVDEMRAAGVKTLASSEV